MRAFQATPLPKDCHASFLRHSNLAFPPVKNNNETKSQVTTTMTESRRDDGQRLHVDGEIFKILAWFIFYSFAVADQSVRISCYAVAKGVHAQ